MNFDADNQKKIMDLLMEIFEYDIFKITTWLTTGCVYLRDSDGLMYTPRFMLGVKKYKHVLYAVNQMKEEYAQEKTQKQS